MSEEENIEEQPTEDKPKPQQNVEENISQKQPIEVKEPQTENMEVLQHPHHPDSYRDNKKKWTEYLLEFFMLFLAVFLGFVAENQREHIVEHQREKQFIVMLVEDLMTDTAELKKSILNTDSTDHYTDSVLIFLSTHKISDQLPVKLANLMRIAGQRLSLVNTDRTSSQLKNSGAMRIIRSKKVADGILRYWNQIEKTNITLERYLVYRNAGRELSFKLFMWAEVYRRINRMNDAPIKYLKVIDKDPKKWDELINIFGGSGLIVSSGHMDNLKKQFELAKYLIDLIKKEYHLQ
jgi:hypothetical protein